VNKKVGITEVVLRDGNQSLLSTRLKLEDIIPIASKMDIRLLKVGEGLFLILVCDIWMKIPGKD
jgi:pyruvate carboxylase